MASKKVRTRDAESRSQHSVRIEPEDIERIDAMAKLLSERAAGVEVSRMATMRAAMLRGLDALEEELGVKKAKR